MHPAMDSTPSRTAYGSDIQSRIDPHDAALGRHRPLRLARQHSGITCPVR